MVVKNRKSSQDVTDGDVIGQEFHSLVKQLQASYNRVAVLPYWTDVCYYIFYSEVLAIQHAIFDIFYRAHKRSQTSVAVVLTRQ